MTKFTNTMMQMCCCKLITWDEHVTRGIGLCLVPKTTTQRC